MKTKDVYLIYYEMFIFNVDLYRSFRSVAALNRALTYMHCLQSLRIALRFSFCKF